MNYSFIFTFFVVLLIASPLKATSPEIKWSINPPERSTKTLRVANIGELEDSTQVTESYKFTEEEKNSIVQAHNTARRSVNPPASNMKKMAWDEELAELALDYSKQCVFEHNKDRSAEGYGYVGENIYLSAGKDFNAKYAEDSVISWDEEKNDYDFNSKTCVPGKMCGHYTQVVWGSSSNVGCGASLCASVNVNGQVWNDAIILICNYGPGGNYKGQHPYMVGQPCSACGNGFNLCQNKLCTKDSGNEVTPTLPVLPMWMSWIDWSSCSVTCGGGNRQRSRVCSSGSSSDCVGKAEETDTCNLTPCSFEWAAWKSWSECSKSCGGGIKKRKRECPSNACPGRKASKVKCNTKRCPRDESGSTEWSEWSSWEKCSKTCGYGIQKRRRTCNKSLSSLQYSIGLPVDVRICKIENCPWRSTFSSWWW